MTEAYIVDAFRTAGGRRKGRLSGVHPAHLAARTLDALVERTNIDPSVIEDVIMGCVMQAGEQALNIGRHAILESRLLPTSVPAVSIDRQCGSSQQALQFAAQAVMSGTQDVVVAAGVENMTRAPLGISLPQGGGHPRTPEVFERFGVKNFSQFDGAEMIAEKWGFTREQMDAFGLESQAKAAAAIDAGAFDAEIVPIAITLPDGSSDMHVLDEGVRRGGTMESMAGLEPLSPGGRITAATSSQICDGASAALIVSEKALKDYGLTPSARIVNLTITGGDPVIMLEEPLFATERALKRAGMRLDDIDLYEVNEAFASVPMAWMAHHHGDPAKLNVNGGAIALGHPLGASGTKLMATLIHALKARGKRYGLQTMCEGGGMANVTIIERL
ncbi:acetyl-CoA C-acetyltransferase [Novosphingobium colocasiae]|uniref:Acetyl-CoA acetyltransferase n=1 Tax=Novosphingobium colocasiae TaxID=1256513 RepID=A0A918UKG2_9SPHN|nr:acetyl-CoA C-acetyltransferase [Novosphingobium colocasiae]GGZ16840.1 acetyl-CoA acetyltransferase [Novosphingobium colocasiae]